MPGDQLTHEVLVLLVRLPPHVGEDRPGFLATRDGRSVVVRAGDTRDALRELAGASGAIGLGLSHDPEGDFAGVLDVLLRRLIDLRLLGLLVDTSLPGASMGEAAARPTGPSDAIRQIQEARKTSGLDVADRIVLRYRVEHEETSVELATHNELVADEVLAVDFAEGEPSWTEAGSHTDDAIGLTFWIRKA